MLTLVLTNIKKIKRIQEGAILSLAATGMLLLSICIYRHVRKNIKQNQMINVLLKSLPDEL